MLTCAHVLVSRKQIDKLEACFAAHSRAAALCQAHKLAACCLLNHVPDGGLIIMNHTAATTGG